MLTSYYSKWSKVYMPGGISISRSQENYRHPVYEPLVPGSWCFNSSPIDYIPQYEDQLAKLDPKTVWAELHLMAKDNAVKTFNFDSVKAVEPVLLCFEAPGSTSANFCHRRLVAQWFQSEIGKVVSEGYVDKKTRERRTVANFDTLCRIEPDGRFVRLDKETEQGQGTLELF